MSWATKDSRYRLWWGYIKGCVRKYSEIPVDEAGTDIERRELEAVQRAVARTQSMKHGGERLALIELVYWKRTHTVPGAALELFISERTALRWHGEFIRTVAREFFGSELTPGKTKKKGDKTDNAD